MTASTILRRDHPSFPTALRDIPEWPTRLHCHGALSPEGSSIAIVGARAASRSGMLRARELAMHLAESGHRIISGGALGVDSAAHLGALAGGGITVAVMACGLDSYYPRRNQELFEAMLTGGGAIVSPYEIGCKPLPGRFVRRNQVIAALADLVIVVEASAGSGSIHTARFALGLGRKLAVVPGSPGCEALRARGVAAIRSASDATSILHGQESAPVLALPPAGSPYERVLSALSPREPRAASDLRALLEMPTREVSRLLLGLQLDLLAIALPGQRYLLSPLAAAAKGLVGQTTPEGKNPS